MAELKVSIMCVVALFVCIGISKVNSAMNKTDSYLHLKSNEAFCPAGLFNESFSSDCKCYEKGKEVKEMKTEVKCVERVLKCCSRLKKVSAPLPEKQDKHKHLFNHFVNYRISLEGGNKVLSNYPSNGLDRIYAFTTTTNNVWAAWVGNDNKVIFGLNNDDRTIKYLTWNGLYFVLDEEERIVKYQNATDDDPRVFQLISRTEGFPMTHGYRYIKHVASGNYTGVEKYNLKEFIPVDKVDKRDWYFEVVRIG